MGETNWSLGGMFADPNFQLLLANMGKAADPEGVGGVIGGAAANMISSKAAQTTLEKRDAQRQAQINRLVELHGGLTPKDSPGVTSIKRTPSGGVMLDVDLPPLDTSIGPGSQTTQLATQATQRKQPLTQTQSAPAPVSNMPGSVPQTQIAPTPVRTVSVRRPELDEIFPFYSAPEVSRAEVLRG